jgi:hypothetical protein
MIMTMMNSVKGFPMKAKRRKIRGQKERQTLKKKLYIWIKERLILWKGGR